MRRHCPVPIANHVPGLGAYRPTQYATSINRQTTNSKPRRITTRKLQSAGSIASHWYLWGPDGYETSIRMVILDMLYLGSRTFIPRHSLSNVFPLSAPALPPSLANLIARVSWVIAQ